MHHRNMDELLQPSAHFFALFNMCRAIWIEIFIVVPRPLPAHQAHDCVPASQKPKISWSP